MVRSYWMGPVFGVLALTALAHGQTTPSAPPERGAMKDQIVTVQEAGKPAQRCKVLRTWTESDGTRAFQAQTLDTGEMMTIEETSSAATPPAAPVRAMSMRIFHWGRGDTAPAGTPQPPLVAAAPPAPKASRGFWPSAFAVGAKPQPTPVAQRPTPPTPPVVPPIAQAAPAAKMVELTPMPPTATAANPAPAAPMASAPIKPADDKGPDTRPTPTLAASPYAPKPAPVPTAATPLPKMVNGSPYAVKSPAVAAVKPPEPAPPMIVRQSEEKAGEPTIWRPSPKPGDWRQSWGKADPSAMTDDPLTTPEKYAKVPNDRDFGQQTKAPLLTMLAAEKSAATLKTTANPPAVNNPAELKPEPPVNSAKPLAAAAPAAPLGMASVLAASSPELAPPSPAAKPAAASSQAAMGLNPNEPNAFSGPNQGGDKTLAANAFSAPAPGVPAPADALAMNAFPAASPQPSAAAPTPAAVATRPGMPPPQMATGYVVPAGYQQASGFDLSQLTSILRDSLFPSQREWAAESLAAMDWHRQPQIVDVLVDRAKNDPAPAVRAECVRSLGRMKADAAVAVEAVKALQTDAEEGVRQAAVEALPGMTGAAPSH